MATNAYLERLGTLRKEKADNLSARTGLPLNRPLSQQASPLAEAPQQPQQQQFPEGFDEMGLNQDSMFARTIKDAQSGDVRFDEFLKEYSDMAMGLRESVASGMMPEAIARQRLQQYVGDSAKWFSNNPTTPLDNPQMNQVIEGLLSGQIPSPATQGGENGPV